MPHSEPDSGAPPGSGKWFATTHWTVVIGAADSKAPGAQEALEKLCRTYWFPLYAYVRRQGKSQEDAQDLTQEFFARFLQKDHLGRVNRERGKFRTFLLTSLQNFLRHEWEKARAQKRGGGRTPVPWDDELAETNYLLEASNQLTPAQIFERRYALALFRNALARLQEECTAKEKSVQFEELKGFLSADPGEGKYAEIASRLGMSSSAVAVAVHRLRQRYGELVREEVSYTVGTPAEVEEEMRYLIKLIGS